MESLGLDLEHLQGWAHYGVTEASNALDVAEEFAVATMADYDIVSPIRPRVLLVTALVTTVMVLYSSFLVLLGVFLARIFGKSGDAQIMQMIHQLQRAHDDALAAKEAVASHKRSRAWWKSVAILCTVVVEVLLLGAAYLYEVDALQQDDPDYLRIATECSPLIVLPVLAFVLYKSIAFWHTSRISANEATLASLKKQHIELVKRYEQKIDAEQHKRVMKTIEETRFVLEGPKRTVSAPKPPAKVGTKAGTSIPVQGGARRVPPETVSAPKAVGSQVRRRPVGQSGPIRQPAPKSSSAKSSSGSKAGAAPAVDGNDAPAGTLISSAMGILSGGSETVKLTCKACGNDCGEQSIHDPRQFDCRKCGMFNDQTKEVKKEVEAGDSSKKEK